MIGRVCDLQVAFDTWGPLKTTVDKQALKSWRKISQESLRKTFDALQAVPMPQRLSGNIAPGWRISQPLLVKLERDDDGCYIVSDDQFAVYGDGRTSAEALRDYVESLIDYYQLLAARAKSDPPTEALFRRLQQYLRPVSE